MSSHEERSDFSRLHHRLATARRTLDQASGRREALRQREEELINEVGLAKGRLEVKPKVDAFLADLQAEANERSVGAYSRLLTGLVGDVLGTHAGTVELDLYTNQGLPALDLYVRTSKGKRVSVLNHSAGSLINLVSLGLRATSTVRSGKRRFIALDEPDCWTRPSRVPQFYSVIDQLARNLGVQFLVVSHNDPALLPESTAIVKLRLGSSGSINVEPPPHAPRWEEDSEGIRSIRLIDFRNHKDTTIPLSPGVTAIVGDNSIGKSAVLHAFRCICYGDVVDGDIRDDAEKDHVRIELAIEGGRRVCLTRQPGRNPVNEWTVIDEAGKVLHDEHSGHPLRRGGRTPPEFVARFLGIERMEGLDVQLSHQLFPVFLLGEVASKRAAVLSIGRESGHISGMIARQKVRCQQDALCVRSGEAEIAALREKLRRLEALDGTVEAVEQCEKELRLIEERQRSLQRIKRIIDSHDAAQRRHEVGKRRIEALEGLPDSESHDRVGAQAQRTERLGNALRRLARAEGRKNQALGAIKRLASLPEEPPKLIATEEMRRVGAKLASLRSQRELYAKTEAALAGLPEEAPKLINVHAQQSTLQRVEKIMVRRTEAGEKEQRLANEVADARQAVDDLLTELGNACPTCGSHVESAGDLLQHEATEALEGEAQHA